MAYSNTTLKGSGGEWVVGELLGAGACAEVYACARGAITERHGSRARAHATARCSSSFVVKCAAVPPSGGTGKVKKARVDQKRAADTLFAEHLLYANVLNRSPRRFGSEVAYGESGGVRFLVLERLGRSLGDELARLRARRERIAPAALAAVGVDVLDALEALHSSKYAYSDVKPENVMLGTWDGGAVAGAHEARLVDFGVASRYVSAVTGGHRCAGEAAGGGGGTPRFSGLAAHAQGAPPCRRDDVEALGHLLLCAAAGDALPWDGADDDGDVPSRRRGERGGGGDFTVTFNASVSRSDAS